MAAGYSTAAVSMGHLALKRAIRHAEANDLISRNVAEQPCRSVAWLRPDNPVMHGPRSSGR